MIKDRFWVALKFRTMIDFFPCAGFSSYIIYKNYAERHSRLSDAYYLSKISNNKPPFFDIEHFLVQQSFLIFSFPLFRAVLPKRLIFKSIIK